MRNTAMLTIGVLGLVVAGCGGDGPSSAATPTVESAAVASSTVSTTSAPDPAATTSSTMPATSVAPTTTQQPGPPTYEPQQLGDSLDLDSFVLTITVDNTNSGELTHNGTTFAYTRQPEATYRIAEFGEYGGTRSYLINGRYFDENQFGDWNLYEAGSRAVPKPSDNRELHSEILASVLTAELVGHEDYAGVPANHFVFNETDTANYSYYTPENPSPTVEGDFYLAQDGNYVLYAHSKESSPGRVYEVTESMSFIGLVNQIALPDDMAPMASALDLGASLTSLLPPGSALSGLLRYKNGIGIDYFTYTTTAKSNDEVLDFYRTMPPTNGWSVTHIGHIATHLEPNNCETRNECVILQNGGEQLAISFAGTILLEYDHQHIFSPLA
ncbi:MAG TPA: hypothetical protein PK020_12650 [Ilumatobacteraceae bacterium]|nr:hypothetical protein [Ilumatobacteraceae bacterium]